MNWININKQLPPKNNIFGGKTYIVTVMCDTWKKPLTMVMNWECTEIRGKEVQRWKWHDRLKTDGWEVTHWMELPEPAIN